ncbi:hypothetical protein HDU98_011764 [Podochytrium sp. JEL0797]|nr:hypothetical protein HDU98_011764 [Podochytrium sp. JEL0797]
MHLLKSLLAVAVAALAVSADSVTSFKKYIVVFKDTSIQSQMDQVTTQISAWGGHVTHRYTIINAVAAELPASLAPQLTEFDQVDYIEEDGEVHANSGDAGENVAKPQAEENV